MACCDCLVTVQAQPCQKHLPGNFTSTALATVWRSQMTLPACALHQPSTRPAPSCCRTRCRKWLLGLLILQSTSSLVLDQYQQLLKDHLVVTLFLTMLVGAGGNAGKLPSQALGASGCFGLALAVMRLMLRELKRLLLEHLLDSCTTSELVSNDNAI